MTTPAGRKRHFVKWVTDEAGISLLEVLAGIIMVSLGLLTLLPLASLSISENELSGDSEAAVAILQSHIERLCAEPAIMEGSQTDPKTGMNAHWWVEADSNGLQKVNVEVTWHTDLGVPRYQRATTYVLQSKKFTGQ